jgi:hypothetical protein
MSATKDISNALHETKSGVRASCKVAEQLAKNENLSHTC